MTPELHRSLKYWKKRLNLQDWNVELIETTTDKIKGNAGDSQWDASITWAKIRLALDIEKDPIYHDGGIEATLIHELLHLRLEWYLPDYLPYDLHRETALNKIADALYFERRRRRPKSQ
jgi:hypothetical protein